MIKAIEANEKAKAYAVKVIADSRQRAITWVEEKVAPGIQAEAEKGQHSVVIRPPKDVEWVYARDFLKENGYNTECHSYGDYCVRW